MRNLKLEVMYDGSQYYGFCQQPGLKTIEAEIGKAVFELTSEKVKIVGAGRTDRGVHAESQVVNFKTISRLSAEKFKAGLNAHLPKDIRVIQAEWVKEEFHSRYGARSKKYIYTIFEGEEIPYNLRQYAFKVRPGIDMGKLKKASKLVEGEHDFSSFAKELNGKNPVRKIFRIGLKAKKNRIGKLIEIEFIGNGFLYNMVRRLVGTLLEVGYNKRSINSLKMLLSRPDNKKCGKTAPAHGLRLSEVNY